MILNGNTDSHSMYQAGRRAKQPKQVRPHSGFATGNCPPKGANLEEKSKWMRGRQEMKRRMKGARTLRNVRPEAQNG